MGIGTDCIHAGQSSEPTTGAVTVPVFQTSTYEQMGIGQHRVYEYARTQNPTREAFERCVAALEKAEHGIAFASGLAAIGTIIQLLSAGDHVVCTNNVYGGTYRVFDQLYRRMGIQFDFVDSSDLANVEKAWRDTTKMLFVESPTNPVLGITDLAGAAEIAHRRGAILVVDNTFMSPCLQRPLEYGADVVVHSTTKYINGHSDMVGGIVATGDDGIHERLRFLQNAAGAVPGPWDCWLALRGIKTLHLRMREHEKNAQAVVEMLQTRDEVQKLYYPGLPNHPGHDVARRQQSGFGAMISFDVGSLENAQKIVQGVRIFTLAESLGGVESLISHPAAMTHAAVPKVDRDAMGVTDGLVRLSVGVEDVEDLVQDIQSALSEIR
jgi:cystathionine beta-lyase/cystathionine gamma-synthase